jgi:hypothetical protein
MTCATARKTDPPKDWPKVRIAIAVETSSGDTLFCTAIMVCMEKGIGLVSLGHEVGEEFVRSRLKLNKWERVNGLGWG